MSNTGGVTEVVIEKLSVMFSAAVARQSTLSCGQGELEPTTVRQQPAGGIAPYKSASVLSLGRITAIP
jgi:hypothetical protein